MCDAGGDKFPRVVTATRLHLPEDATRIPEATEEHLRNYVAAAELLGATAAIAVNTHAAEVRRVAEEAAPGFRLHVLPVPCWGAFVPALNALLNFAQSCCARHILYQSLEVQCAPAVLRRMMDHQNDDTLVVGPVLSGHKFEAGERGLNGRTAPWNTLALWSVRKLALTGFLCIADGLQDAPSLGRDGMVRRPADDSGADGVRGLMGSDDWWVRQLSPQAGRIGGSVPAGVEEVTAIALLQHLHGVDRARAVLLQLPKYLERQCSWSADWGKDERRAKWHQYKMASKVSRPAAQLQELFKFKQEAPLSGLGDKITGALRGSRSSPELTNQGKDSFAPCGGISEKKEDFPGMVGIPCSRNFGTVMHYSESIPPPQGIKWICLAACGLFSMNSTAVLSSAFRHINSAPTCTSASTITFVGLLIGGVYLPMPASLWLTRRITLYSNHIAGLALFGSFLLLGNALVVLAQLLDWGSRTLLVARLVQGLGSGVLFQVRFVLASVSTGDLHAQMQSWMFLVSDLGLGVGALLPAATASLPGSTRLRAEMPEFLPALVLAMVSLTYMVWVFSSFPRRLPILGKRVRFPNQSLVECSPSTATRKESRDRMVAWVSGTTRVFVQSAILPTVAFSMRDAHWTGNFRQTFAVAAICLLPMPFEAVVSRICCTCSMRSQHPGQDGVDFSKVASGVIGAVALAISSAAPQSVLGDHGDLQVLAQRLCVLAILMIALAMAAPFNATRLYQLKDAERAIVMLEWMKAYIGRLLGPLFAVLIYDSVGYGALLFSLCTATAVVTLTA